MKVVLKQDVKSMGKAGDIKEVAAGYAKNFLFRGGLAVLATNQSIKQAEQKKEITLKKREQVKSEMEELFKKLKNFKLKTKMKFGDGETAFGSVTAQNVSDLLKEKGFDIEIKNIILDSNIKTLGEHKVKIDLGFDLKSEVSVIIEKE